MARQWYLAVVVLLLVIAAATVGFLWVDGDDSGGFEIRQGQTLVYADAQGRLTVRYHVASKTVVRGPAGERREAVPVYQNSTGVGEPLLEVRFLSAETGLQLVNTKACILDRGRGCSGEPIYTGFSACPLPGPPFGVVPLLDDPEDGDVLTYRSEIARSSYSYRISQSDQRLVVELIGDSHVPNCGISRIELDRREGVVRSFTSGDNLTLKLQEHDPGTGPVLEFPGSRTIEDRLVPLQPRRNPYPPGARRLGPDAWSFGRAWDGAKANLSEFRSFLTSHPDAFLFEASNLTERDEDAAGVEQVEYRWTFAVLAPDRQFIEVEATRRVVQGTLTEENYSANPGQPPDRVPARFRPPPDRAAKVQAYAKRLSDFDLDLADQLPEPLLRVTFSDAPDQARQTHFRYEAWLTTEATDGGRVGQEWIALSGGTGRWTSASMEPNRTRQLILPSLG